MNGNILIKLSSEVTYFLIGLKKCSSSSGPNLQLLIARMIERVNKGKTLFLSRPKQNNSHIFKTNQTYTKKILKTLAKYHLNQSNHSTRSRFHFIQNKIFTLKVQNVSNFPGFI